MIIGHWHHPVTFINFRDRQEWLFSLRSWQCRRILQINPGFGNIPFDVPGYVLAGTMTTSCFARARLKVEEKATTTPARWHVIFSQTICLAAAPPSRRRHAREQERRRAWRAASAYSHCNGRLYILRGPYCHALYNAAGIPSGAASDWVAGLRTFHAGESRAGWSSLMRQERATAEAKQRSHPHLCGSVPSSSGVNLQSNWRPRRSEEMQSRQRAPSCPLSVSQSAPLHVFLLDLG